MWNASCTRLVSLLVSCMIRTVMISARFVHRGIENERKGKIHQQQLTKRHLITLIVKHDKVISGR